MGQHPSVVIVDDHSTIITSLARTFRGHLHVVGKADNAAAGLAAAIAHSPDLVVMDVFMPGMCAFAACEAIIEQVGSRVLFFTGHPRLHFVDQALKAGARGIACKGTERAVDVRSILLSMHKNEAFEYWATQWYDRYERLSDDTEPPASSTQLTPRQVSILQDIACGRSEQEICEKHGFGRDTYYRDLANAKMLLNSRNTCELIATAAAEGLISHDMCDV